jgi:hypothetical protein
MIEDHYLQLTTKQKTAPQSGRNTNTPCPPPPKTLSPFCIPAKPSPYLDFSFLVRQPLLLLEHDDSVEMFLKADGKPSLSAKKEAQRKS